jgi:hypothetical protein
MLDMTATLFQNFEKLQTFCELNIDPLVKKMAPPVEECTFEISLELANLDELLKLVERESV